MTPRTTYWERAARRREKAKAVALGAVFGGSLILGMMVAPGDEAPARLPSYSECPQ